MLQSWNESEIKKWFMSWLHTEEVEVLESTPACYLKPLTRHTAAEETCFWMNSTEKLQCRSFCAELVCLCRASKRIKYLKKKNTTYGEVLQLTPCHCHRCDLILLNSCCTLASCAINAKQNPQPLQHQCSYATKRADVQLWPWKIITAQRPL